MKIEICNECQTCNECNNARNYQMRNSDGLPADNMRHSEIYNIMIGSFTSSVCKKCFGKLVAKLRSFNYERNTDKT